MAPAECATGAKRRKQEEGSQPCKQRRTDVDVVSEVLLDRGPALEGTPHRVRTLLAEILRHAVVTSEGEEAHAYQREMTSFVEGILGDCLNAASAALRAQKLRVGEADEHHGSATEEAAKLLATKESALAVVRQREEEQNAARNKVSEAGVVHEAATAEVEPIVAECAAAEREVAEAEAARAELFRPLVDDDLEQESAAGFTKKLLAFLEAISAEKALLAAAPSALQAARGERKEFDELTLKAIAKTLDAKVSQAAARAAESGPAVEDAKAEVLGAWAILDVAGDREKAASRALAQAREAAEVAEAEAQRQASQAEDALGKLAAERAKEPEDERRVQDIEAALEALRRLLQGDTGNRVAGLADDAALAALATPSRMVTTG